MRVGQTLSSFTITQSLGSGGMGEVYRARDAKLGREVAIKVLRPEVAGDPDRLARFRREAHVLASLNHPHIAGIYGFEEVNGTAFLVLELVEGEDLAERLRRGPLPVQDALDIAKQTAEALEAAHERGVIHRDLKPANVKVTAAGTAKVLDFGLAKAWAGEGTSGVLSEDPSLSPTLASSGTVAGAILGTAGYMSPEQMRGRPVDRRTDVWAFGVVLFELLTGRPLFAGDTITDLIAAVVTTEPDWSRLPPDTPAAVRRLLRRCLQRDPRLRLPDIGSARLELAELLTGVAEPETGVTLTPPHGYQTPARRTARVVVWSLAVLAVGVATGAFVALRQFRGERVEQSLRRVSLLTPPDLQVGRFAPPLISPDGRHVVIASLPTDRPSMLWIRHLDSLPFELLKQASLGGGVQTVATLGSKFWAGATWSAQDVIVMSKGAKGQEWPRGATLVTITPTTGRMEALTTLDTARGETGHYWPQFLPDGRHIAVEIASTNPQHQGVFITALDAPQERRPLLPERTTPGFANGHVLFVRRNVLFSQPYDAVKLQVGGEPVAIAQNVDFWSQVGVGMFSTSDDGAVVYSPARARDSQMAWVARNGATLSVIGRAQPYRQLTLSPDQKRAAVEMIGADGGWDIWLLELARGTTTRVTIDPANDVDPVWSPDGTALIFASDRTHGFALFRKSLTNNQPEASLSATTQDVLTGCRIGTCGAESFTPDGKAIVYYKREGTQLLRAVAGEEESVGFVWRLDGSAPPQAILQTGYAIDELQVSPDGRFLAYISTESGQYEVYLQPFGRSGEKVRVSTTGGGAPKWRPDGKELFYVAPNRKLMSVRILPGRDVSISLPEPLFDLSDFQPDQDDYAPSLDGQRFLVKLPVEPLATQTPLQLILNWNRTRTAEGRQ